MIGKGRTGGAVPLTNENGGVSPGLPALAE
jgi:hypothetical protein